MGTKFSGKYAAFFFFAEVYLGNISTQLPDITHMVTKLIFIPMNASNLVHDDELFLN
jgi:hypothetical protein